MPDFVRVKDTSTGHEGTISRARADQLGDAVEVVDEPATKGRNVRRPKPAQRGDVAAASADQPPTEPQAPAAKPTRPTAPKEPTK